MATSSSFSSPIFISSWNGGCLLEYNLTTGLAFCFANLPGIGGLAFADMNVSVVKGYLEVFSLWSRVICFNVLIGF